MKRFVKVLTGGALGVLYLSVVEPAHAQTADASQQAQDGAETIGADIIVTAQRREERAIDVPISLTTYTGEELANRNITDLSELAAYTPGLDVAPSGSGGAALTIRGISTDVGGVGVDPSVGVYIDGVYVARDWVALQSYLDVDRVEVLRGPQGTLYGRNSTGGAYNIYRAAPTEEWEAGIEALFGSFDRQRYMGHVSGPLIDDRLLVRFAASRETSEEYGRNLLSDQRLQAADAWQALGAIEARLTDNLTITLRADGMEDNGRVGTLFHLLRPGTANAGAIISDNPYEYRNDFPPDDNYLRNYGWSAHIDWELGEYTVRSISGGRYIRINTEYDTDYSELPIYTAVLNDRSDSFSQEFQVLSPTDGAFQWIIGAHYYQEDARDLTTSGGPAIETFPGTLFELVNNAFVDIPVRIPFENRSVFDSENATKSYAAFGQFTYKFTEKLGATLGVRYTHEKRTFDGFVQRQYDALATGFDASAYCADVIATEAVAFPVGQPAQQDSCVGRVNQLIDFRLNQLDVSVGRSTQSLTFNDFSPRFVIDYYPNPDTHLYASVTKGFKSGGFNSYDTNAIIVDANGDGFVTAEDAGEIPFQPPFDPERLWSYEVGVKGATLGRKLQYAVGAFYYDWSNIQVQITDFISRLSFITNDSKAWAMGIELNLVAYPWTGGIVDFNGGWVDSKYTQFGLNTTTVSPEDDRTGQPLRGTPSWKWSVGVQHTLAVENAGDFTLRGEWNHRTRSYDPIDERRGGEYDIFNARLNWRDANNGFSVGVSVDNVFNTAYNYYRFGNDLTGLVEGTAPPRRVTVRLGANF